LRKATQLALSANDLPTACARAEQWVSIAPNDVGAYEMLFDVLLKQARYEAAATVINDALTIYSDQPRLLRKASLVALQRGDVAGATQFAERWRVSTPGDAWAHDQLSILYLRAANYDKAKAANSKSLELDPTNSNFLRRAEQIQAKAS
jgi:tetratricopeptide (TPR) repeat protein